MKAKHIKITVITLIVLFSMLSYCYLNFNLAQTNTNMAKHKIEAESDEKEEAEIVLTELSVLKSIGKKFIEVVTFVI